MYRVFWVCHYFVLFYTMRHTRLTNERNCLTFHSNTEKTNLILYTYIKVVETCVRKYYVKVESQKREKIGWKTEKLTQDIIKI